MRQFGDRAEADIQAIIAEINIERNHYDYERATDGYRAIATIERDIYKKRMASINTAISFLFIIAKRNII